MKSMSNVEQNMKSMSNQTDQRHEFVPYEDSTSNLCAYYDGKTVCGQPREAERHVVEPPKVGTLLLCTCNGFPHTSNCALFPDSVRGLDKSAPESGSTVSLEGQLEVQRVRYDADVCGHEYLVGLATRNSGATNIAAVERDLELLNGKYVRVVIQWDNKPIRSDLSAIEIVKAKRDEWRRKADDGDNANHAFYRAQEYGAREIIAALKEGK